MSHKNGATIGLTVTSESHSMSVDKTNDELFLTRAPIDCVKPSYKTSIASSSYPGSIPKIASTNALFPFAALPAVLTKSSKITRILNKCSKVFTRCVHKVQNQYILVMPVLKSPSLVQHLTKYPRKLNISREI